MTRVAAGLHRRNGYARSRGPPGEQAQRFRPRQLAADAPRHERKGLIES